jgi:ribose 5-phosphate isomerase B
MGSDHGGFKLKEAVKAHLTAIGHEVVDVGTHTETSSDYPEFGRKAAELVAAGACERGIVICSTGIGISISANKVRGVRAALCTDVFTARLTREHNDANVLAMGQYVVGEALAIAITDTWLGTEFSGGERHRRRIDAISRIESDGQT